MGERAEDGYRHDGHRDRRAYRQSGAQAEVGIGRAEDYAEQYSQPDGLDRELGRRFAGRYERSPSPNQRAILR
jgi:hypothetical protein